MRRDAAVNQSSNGILKLWAMDALTEYSFLTFRALTEADASSPTIWLAICTPCATVPKYIKIEANGDKGLVITRTLDNKP
jgi:hypothetical protein